MASGPGGGGQAEILAVGLACVDIILGVDRTPNEDAEERARSRRVARGGNSASTLAVLAELGVGRCTFVGAFGPREASRAVTDDLEARGVRVAGTWDETASVPTSYITMSAATGARTIVHYRGPLRELSPGAFAGVRAGLGGGFAWAHLEPRVPAETLEMARALLAETPRPVLSIEVEKPKHLGSPELVAAADVVFCSQDMEGAVRALPRVPGQIVTFTRGSAGAVCIDGSGAEHACGARPGGSVVDTVGAGDAFIAGFIAARCRGAAPAAALRFAVIVSGRKVAQEGFDGVGARSRAELDQIKP